jgi:hypothetical protein
LSIIYHGAFACINATAIYRLPTKGRGGGRGRERREERGERREGEGERLREKWRPFFRKKKKKGID